MGILDIFKATPAPQQTVQTPVVAAPGDQGGIPSTPTVTVDPANPTAPVTDPAANSAPAPAADPNTVKSPLDPFTKLWENVPNKDDKTSPAPVPLNAEQLQKAMANVDFSDTITPEQLTAIQNGGEEAAAALPVILNTAIRQSMVQSTLINNKLTEKAIADAVASHLAELPAQLRSQTASNHLKDTNPIFNHPAVKPVMEATQAKLMVQHPDATPAELTQMTQDFVLAMGQAITPQQVVNDNGVDNTDWEKFMLQE